MQTFARQLRKLEKRLVALEAWNCWYEIQWSHLRKSLRIASSTREFFKCNFFASNRFLWLSLLPVSGCDWRYADAPQAGCIWSCADILWKLSKYITNKLWKWNFRLQVKCIHLWNLTKKFEFGRSGLNRALLEVRRVQSVQANSAMEGCHVFLKTFHSSPRSFFYVSTLTLPFHYVVTTSLQEPTKAKVFSSCRPDFFSSLFLRFLERPNGLTERLQFHDFHVVFFTVLCSLQSCCESVSILSKSFECHMLGVWRTRHRCQSSHFPRDCVVTYLFKIQSPSLHLSLFLKWMRMHCFKQLLADRR